MKTKIDINDFWTLMIWIKTYDVIEGKDFKFESLFQQVETYKYTNTPLDINIHPIDHLMLEAYYLYNKLKTTEDRVSKVLDLLTFVDKEEVLSETNKYFKIFEDIIENYMFDEPEIRGIQKGILTEKMNECVMNEEYENAAKYRDFIKKCFFV